jgi:NlpC/P60 family
MNLNCRLLLLGLIFIFSALLPACQKGDLHVDPKNVGDNLTKEDNVYWDSKSIPNPPLHQILGYDDNPLARQEADLINTILRKAHELADVKTLKHNNEAQPNHWGYAYSYGQRDLSQRLKPLYGNTLHTTSAVWGTDCSGFILNLFWAAGITVANTDVAGFETTLRTALKNDPSYNTVKVANLGFKRVDELRTGDLILWFRPQGNHIGIVAHGPGGQKIIYMSSGTGNPDSQADQDKNLGPSRGINVKSFVQATDPYHWGTGYTILRMESGLIISNPSTYPVTEQLTSTFCGGYVICDFKVSADNWDLLNNRPTFMDANGITRPVNGVLLEKVTNNWGWNFTSCTSSSSYALKFYDHFIDNNTVKGKVKVIGDFGNCSPPYSNQYFTSFKFTLIYSSLSADMQTSYQGTYQLASNFLIARQ